MKEPPEYHDHHRHNGRRRRGLSAFLLLLTVCLVVVSSKAARLFTGSTSSDSSSSSHASLLRRSHGEQEKQQYHENVVDVKSSSFPPTNGGIAFEQPSSFVMSSRPHHHHHSRVLQDASSQCDEACCAPFVEAATAEASTTPTDCPASETSPFASTPLWVQIMLIIILLMCSAMFSGLTLGLMGLDISGLEIVMDGDDEKMAKFARIIYPMRKKGNLLLCTLLLGNVAVNSLLSILVADNFGGTVGFVSSTFLIVIFGEIVPQALCQRYSLQIGSKAVPIVRVIMVLLLPISFPLAWILDKALGQELATTYSSAEMLKLLQIHVREDKLDPETAAAMGGALRYKSILVREVMTTMDKTFMLSAEDKLNFETIARIFKTGYSRIPVFKVSKNNVIGLLFVKDLIFIDPEDDTRVEDFVNIFGRGLHVVWPDDSLGDVLRELKQGKSHMALVRDVNNEDDKQDPFYEIKGIITLEDVIEEILGEEIVDETDAFVDNNQTQSTRTGQGLGASGTSGAISSSIGGVSGDSGGGSGDIVGGSCDTDFRWGALRLLDAKLVDDLLSHDETKAVVAHLEKNYAHALGDDLLTENQLFHLVATTPVSNLPTAMQEIAQEIPDSEYLLYEKGVPNDFCTIILSGKVTVLVGADHFRSDVSSWSVLAADALTAGAGAYKPDFSAFVSAGPCRCLRISHAKFSEAVDSSALERHHHGTSDSSGAGAGTGGSGKTLGTGTTSSGGMRTLGGEASSAAKGSVAKTTSTTISGGVSTTPGAVGTAVAPTTSAATSVVAEGLSSLNESGHDKKHRLVAALKVVAGETSTAANRPPSLSSPPPRLAGATATSNAATNTASTTTPSTEPSLETHMEEPSSEHDSTTEPDKNTTSDINSNNEPSDK